LSAPPPPPGQYPPPPPPPPPYQQPPYQQPTYGQPQYQPQAPPYSQAPYQQAPYPSPPPPKPKSHTVLIVVIVVVVVAVLVIIATIALGLFVKNVASTLTPNTVTVTPAGTVWNINPDYYEEVGPVDLTSKSTWVVSGAFTATIGIAAYVLTSSEYSAWGGSGTPTTYEWTSGPGVTSGDVDTIVDSGTYYFVWENTNSTTGTSVDITIAVTATSE
jgi:hypothetical protein